MVPVAACGTKDEHVVTVVPNLETESYGVDGTLLPEAPRFGRKICAGLESHSLQIARCPQLVSRNLEFTERTDVHLHDTPLIMVRLNDHKTI